MSLRPLYLESGHAWRVRLDGTALCIDSSQRAPTWFPFARMSRVISSTDASWETPALVACLRAGVPILFADGRGEPQAYCWGTRRRETTLAGLLVEAIEHPEWEDRYACWRKGITLQMIRKELIRENLPIRHDTDDAAARSDLCNRHHQRMGKPVGRLLRGFRAPIHAMVSESLQRIVDEPLLLDHPRPGLSFIGDFAAVMEWSVHTIIRRANHAEMSATPPSLYAALLLEESKEAFTAELTDLTDRFALWLRSWLL